jgi:hypothetical protein
MNTSKETLQMNREDWEFLREFMKAPLKKEYLKHLEREKEIDIKNDRT